MTFPLETERLLLRPIEPADVDAFAPYMADPEIVRFIGGEMLSRDQVVERLALWRRRFDTDGFGPLALVRREDGCVVGRCSLLVWQVPEWETTTAAEATGPWELELGWILGREHWGRGYATEAARAVLTFALDRVGLDRIVSAHAVGNEASANVMRKIGMHLERETIHPGNGRGVRVYEITRPAKS